MVENLYIGKNPKSAIELIKKFNANPDSNSGIVTVPKVIGSGESVTIPAGRVAVLPNVQVDGEIVVEAGGEMFIPAGSTVDMGNGLVINGEKIVMSVPTSYHLLQGNLAVDNTIITQGFNTTLYTGNGSTQSINTGIDMDTQWGDTAEEKFGGLVWVKSRSLGGTYNTLVDTVRSAGLRIFTNTTDTQAVADGTAATFLNNGFTLTSGVNGCNANLATYASWNFQTTHRISGVTNHGKPYTCHYNPFTGFTMVKYEGSGIIGHEIPHHLGRKLGFSLVKNLSSSADWMVNLNMTESGGTLGWFNKTDTIADTAWASCNDNTFNILTQGTSNQTNTSTNQYILYGWANSYLDEANKLIGNYEISVYQGTGAVGNKVKTRGKPAWVMIKRVDGTGNWNIYNNVVNDGRLIANLSNAESVYDAVDFIQDGFILKTSGDSEHNVSGGQYLYMVAYDTNSDGGGSYYPKATDTANVQINNALIPIAKGSDINGLKNVMLSKNEVITGLTYTAGKNYIYYDCNGNKGVKAYEPRYLHSELVRRFAGESPDYYDIESNKWFNTDAGSELVTNGTFSDGTTTGWTAVNGAILSVVNGTLNVLSGTTDYAYATQEVTVDIGKTYRVKVHNVYNSVSKYYVIEDANGVVIKIVGYEATTNTENVDIIVTAQTNKIIFKLFAGSVQDNAVSRYDNISIFPVDIVLTTEIPEGRNYLNHIVHADNDGGVLYVEELPKIEYKDIIKANEYQGKNACTASGAVNIATTPVTIYGVYGIASIIRTGTGKARLFFTRPMDDLGYSFKGNTSWMGGEEGSVVYFTNKTLTYVDIAIGVPGTAAGTELSPRNTKFDFEITGGKN